MINAEGKSETRIFLEDGDKVILTAIAGPWSWIWRMLGSCIACYIR